MFKKKKQSQEQQRAQLLKKINFNATADFLLSFSRLTKFLGVLIAIIVFFSSFNGNVSGQADFMPNLILSLAIALMSFLQAGLINTFVYIAIKLDDLSAK